jgi:2-haloacid dehalogenase
VEVRAVAFDVFGTLVDWRSTIAGAFADAGVPGDPGELADDWRARLWPATAAVNGGEREWGDLDELHAETLDALLADRGADADAAARAALVAAWHRLAPWPDVRGGLAALRERCVVAALSNGHTALLVDLARHGDLRFDAVLSAELPRRYKPSREVYLTAARLLRVDPAELMLAAAHPLDLEGARRAGLRTAFVDRPLEHGPASPPRSDPQADVSVADLHGLG